jgi:periplasmic protein TonB
MFHTLLESNAERRPKTQFVASAVVLHLCIILGAVRATGGSSAVVSAIPRDTIRLELHDPAPRERHRVSPPALPQAPKTMQASPMVPDISLGELRFDISEFRFVPSDPSVLKPTQAPGDSGKRASPVNGASFVLAVTEVDQPPELERELHPQYPEALRRAGVSGQVDLEYVIQSSGRIDSGTVVVLESSHPAFAESARQAVLMARFKPARRAGLPVAVKVRQRIRFRSQ